jgi:formylglycine-generating enzyme required for sulfatase activity
MTFYEMLCAKTPFEGLSSTTPTAVYSAIVNGKVKPPTHFYPGITKALSAFVMKAIDKDRDNRFANANEMLRELERLERSGETTVPDTKPNRPPYNPLPTPEKRKDPSEVPTRYDWFPTKKRRNMGIFAGSFAVILLIIFGIWASRKTPPKNTAPSNDSETVAKVNSTLTLEQQKEMIKVEGGTFTMGGTSEQGSEAGSDEKPTHEVTVSSFYMGKTELTVGQFKEFIEATGYKTGADKDGGSYIWTGSNWEKKNGVNWSCDTKGEQRPASEMNHPVMHISWYDAIEYCNWLSEKEGLTHCYTIDKENKDPNNNSENDKQKWTVTCNFKANGYRLPTEAEWEYAARGGNKSKGYKYSGSNNLDEVGWYGAYNNSGNRTKEEGTSEVGKKKANELGIHDMSGLVYEWCWDWYGEYSTGSKTNPTGPSTGSYRGLRGGSWSYDSGFCRVAFRGYGSPDSWDDSGGFRLLRTIL